MELRPQPFRSSLEEYEKFAQEVLRGWESGEPEVIQALQKHHPRLSELSDSETRSAEFALADAQLIIARVHGFENWPSFSKYIEALPPDSSFATVWKAAETAMITGDVSTLERLLRENAQLFRERQPPAYGPEPGRLAPDYSGADAQSIIVSNHHFESWARFDEYNAALGRKDSPIAKFEAAVDAIITGDVAALERLLREHPDLIQARSTRKHHATLLHYVGANGVESFRQMTPKNAVTVLKVLLKAGAEVDAVADMYGGGCTTMDLVETSIHPLLAGVQDVLVETLLSKTYSNDGGSKA
jgi:3-dehydroquinate dehydratase